MTTGKTAALTYCRYETWRNVAGNRRNLANPTRSGWGGIRTPAGLSPRAVFKTAAFDHSATHPARYFTVFSWFSLILVFPPYNDLYNEQAICVGCTTAVQRRSPHRFAADGAKALPISLAGGNTPCLASLLEIRVPASRLTSR